jgi:hypothetical protein
MNKLMNKSEMHEWMDGLMRGWRAELGLGSFHMKHFRQK